MKKVAIIQMGLPPDSIRTNQGEPAQWFAQALNIPIDQLLVRNPAANDSLPDASEFDVAIITGSWSMVTDKLDWSEYTARWLRQIITTNSNQLLGVCYGHQIMAYAMGGVVDYNPNGREQGTFTIELNQAGRSDNLLGRMPASFKAHLSHAQSVTQVPAMAQVLASNQHDANQIIRYSDNALSFQFHPEFTLPILKACIAARSPDAQGVFSKPADLVETPAVAQLMRDFVLAV